MVQGSMLETMSFQDSDAAAGAMGMEVAALPCTLVRVGDVVSGARVVWIVLKLWSSELNSVLGPSPEEAVSEACGDEVDEARGDICKITLA